MRDDLLPGGTKQIVLRQWLPEFDTGHFVYTASAYGKGGAALAYACHELGHRCTLFMAQTPADAKAPWIDDVLKLGTHIHWTEKLPVSSIEPQAMDYAFRNGAHYLSLGFARQRFHDLLVEYMQKLPIQPPEIWCPIVSGTMATALERAFPSIPLHGVSVVKHHGYFGAGKVHFAAEKYTRQAASPPSYPSWTYSDAKIWRIAQKLGQDGALIWNSNA